MEAKLIYYLIEYNRRDYVTRRMERYTVTYCECTNCKKIMVGSFNAPYKFCPQCGIKIKDIDWDSERTISKYE